jgi:hypothetical protein
MSEQNLSVDFTKQTTFLIPAFENREEIALDFTKIREGESRFLEAKVVNPATYSELEYSFNESYRQSKTNLSAVGYEIAQSQRIIRKFKSQYLLDDYPEFLKSVKLKDNAANRDAFLERQEDFVAAVDRLNMLQALENLLEGKVKVVENVCRYMRKSMDMIIRSGIDPNKY